MFYYMIVLKHCDEIGVPAGGIAPHRLEEGTLVRFARSLKPSCFATVEGEAKWLSAPSLHNSLAFTNGFNKSIEQDQSLYKQDRCAKTKIPWDLSAD